MSKRIATMLAVAGVWFVSTSSAYAIDLGGINTSGDPHFSNNVKIEIRNDSIKVRKNNGNNAFLLNGTVLGDLDGTNGRFSLDGDFSPTGDWLGGTVSLIGRIPSIGITGNTTLFSAILPSGNSNINWSPLLIGFNTSGLDCASALEAAIGTCSTAESVYLQLDEIFDGNFNATGKNAFTTTGVAVSTIPLPAAVWLFGSGLMGLIGVARVRKAKAA